MKDLENPTKKQLKKMKLHSFAYITQDIELPDDDEIKKIYCCEILRVENGWIYYRLEDDEITNSCFVPESKEVP